LELSTRCCSSACRWFTASRATPLFGLILADDSGFHAPPQPYLGLIVAAEVSLVRQCLSVWSYSLHLNITMSYTRQCEGHLSSTHIIWRPSFCIELGCARDVWTNLNNRQDKPTQDYSATQSRSRLDKDYLSGSHVRAAVMFAVSVQPSSRWGSRLGTTIGANIGRFLSSNQT
jgi:hypothetical protein